MFFGKRVHSSVSRTTITLKFKMSRLLEKRQKINNNDKG